jgi:hypothetical protein
MAHVFESAPTGRAKCRGCDKLIAKGEVRFGEHVPNPFGEGEATLWFHPLCAAYRRPEAILESLPEAPDFVEGRAELERVAKASSAQKRLSRIAGAERSPSGKASCRHCKQPIEKGSWRIRLIYFEEGRFVPSGFIHLTCRGDYFEGHDVADALLFFSPDLSADERSDLTRSLSA